jgi:hypothetical protein
MKTNCKTVPDPLIDEVRGRRAELLARFGGDLRALAREIDTMQAKHPDKMMDRRMTRKRDQQPLAGAADAVARQT